MQNKSITPIKWHPHTERLCVLFGDAVTLKNCPYIMYNKLTFFPMQKRSEIVECSHSSSFSRSEIKYFEIQRNDLLMERAFSEKLMTVLIYFILQRQILTVFHSFLDQRITTTRPAHVNYRTWTVSHWRAVTHSNRPMGTIIQRTTVWKSRRNCVNLRN